MSQSEQSGSEPLRRPWAAPPPGRLVGRGHPAGDFLEAWAWDLLDEAPGYLRVDATLPDHVKNPRGQLFGVALADSVTERLPRHAGRACRVNQGQSVLTFGDLEDSRGQWHGAHDRQHL